jgi:hypothetical protein
VKLDYSTYQIFFVVTLLVGVGLVNCHTVQAQGERQILQLSGLVLGEDSTSGLGGAHIFVPEAGRGTTSNPYGYFSMPVLAGDSVVFSSVGYKRQHYLVPKNASENLTIVVEMQTDTTYLEPIAIFPFPTEELFKEAILALQLPDEDQYNNMRDNLGAELLARMFNNMPMDGSMNHRYYMQQQFDRMQYSAGPRPNPLLNPFAWAEFIKSLKRGDFKKKND